MHDSVSRDWLTRFETSEGLETSTYPETLDFFSALADSSGKAVLQRFGVTPQRRDMHCLVVSSDGVFSPDDPRRNGKLVVLIQNGIHAGEIEGKDACMLLLREILITREKEYLLEELILLVIPILNVDGHERISPHNRPNQIGPAVMGWRTTAENLNLNRDYTKADTPEMQALLSLYATWRPDFIIDNHTTNGADYQYHTLYGVERHPLLETGLSAWTHETFVPFLIERMQAAGFLIAPYINGAGDIREALVVEPSLPRYSSGYASALNRVSLLVEAHSLKPFRVRVMATKSMNEITLEHLHLHHARWREVNSAADTHTIEEFGIKQEPYPLVIDTGTESVPFIFQGIESEPKQSAISGGSYTAFNGLPIEFEVPLFQQIQVLESVVLPAAYVIPVQFMAIVDRLILHGIQVFALESPHTGPADRYRFHDTEFAARPYEGRQRVSCRIERFSGRKILPAGSLVVPTAQRCVRLIAHLLEPASPDSFLRWGFFNAFFERKEYIEPYAMEPLAQQMLDADPTLRVAFERRLSEDARFRNDNGARLDFFYRRSVYFDHGENIYPILRIIDPHELDALRLKRIVQGG